MIDVQDEILNGEPKYRITGDAGNILAENANIEMTTPVQQAGTPLNKALFDKITSRLALSSKYNNPEYTVEENTIKMLIENSLEQYEEGQKVSVYVKPTYENFEGNIFPTTFIDNGFSTDNERLFSGSGVKISGAGTGDVEATISCPIAIVPSEFMVRYKSVTDRAKTFTAEISGSNDGVSWVKLATYSGTNQNTITEYTFANTKNDKAYKKFRIKFHAAITSSYDAYLYMFNIPSGQKSTFNESYEQTIRIGKLTEVPTIGKVKVLEKQSLMYIDGRFLVDNSADVG